MSSRLEKIRSKWSDARLLSLSPTLSPDAVFKLACSVDPTKTYKYTNWVLEAWSNGSILLEDIAQGATSKTAETLASFEKFKNRIGNPRYENETTNLVLRNTIDRSLLRYKTPGDLYKAVRPWIIEEAEYGEVYGSKEQKRLDMMKARLESYHEESPDGVLLDIPATIFAAQKLGMHTKWCTSAQENNAFEQYAETGPLMIVTLPSGERFQAHMEIAQRKDDEEERDYNSFANTYIRIQEILKDYNYGIIDHEDVKAAIVLIVNNMSFMNELDNTPDSDDVKVMEPYRKSISNLIAKTAYYSAMSTPLSQDKKEKLDTDIIPHLAGLIDAKIEMYSQEKRKDMSSAVKIKEIGNTENNREYVYPGEGGLFDEMIKKGVLIKDGDKYTFNFEDKDILRNMDDCIEGFIEEKSKHGSKGIIQNMIIKNKIRTKEAGLLFNKVGNGNIVSKIEYKDKFSKLVNDSENNMRIKTNEVMLLSLIYSSLIQDKIAKTPFGSYDDLMMPSLNTMGRLISHYTNSSLHFMSLDTIKGFMAKNNRYPHDLSYLTSVLENLEGKGFSKNSLLPTLLDMATSELGDRAYKAESGLDQIHLDKRFRFILKSTIEYTNGNIESSAFKEYADKYRMAYKTYFPDISQDEVQSKIDKAVCEAGDNNLKASAFKVMYDSMCLPIDVGSIVRSLTEDFDNGNGLSDAGVKAMNAIQTFRGRMPEIGYKVFPERYQDAMQILSHMNMSSSSAIFSEEDAAKTSYRSMIPVDKYIQNLSHDVVALQMMNASAILSNPNKEILEKMQNMKTELNGNTPNLLEQQRISEIKLEAFTLEGEANQYTYRALNMAMDSGFISDVDIEMIERARPCIPSLVAEEDNMRQSIKRKIEMLQGPALSA